MEHFKAESFLKEQKFNPSKKMGQNFLNNKKIVDKIIEGINIKKIDSILEIGPGIGALTQGLVKLNKPLICVELDKRLHHNLTTTFTEPNVLFINNDILMLDLDEVIEKYKNPIIISNLPYSISTPVIIQFLKSRNIKTMYCMLQKEMAKRLTAKPKTKDYSSFSVLTNYYCESKKLLDIDRNNFVPSPNVDSVFIEIKKIRNDNYDESFSKFLKFIFLAKRKNIKNNLKNLYGKEDIEIFMQEFKYESNVRAEEIDVNTMHKIYEWFKRKKHV